ncbi:MAG TPA: sigma-70 family RNA polymerase sigma factor [Thermoanaerobaculia bacterium]|nr:sigma-70 family RNA polymerase sigma factor [Thermoanaerobaculia bacterium]
MDAVRLVLRAQSGDRDAFDALLRDVAPPLHRYIARLVDDVALADDVTQDVLIAIVRKITWLNDPSLFRAWAYRIASRAAFRALRKRRAVIFEPIEEATAFIESTPEPWLEERVARLSPASRAVITLHYFEEMPLADVADILDLSLGTVKSRLAYGLTQLRKETAS